jgi:hypothetical protein
VQHTAQFNDHFRYKKNRQTFTALKPYMREVEDQLKAMLGPETLTLIKTASVENIVIEAQERASKQPLKSTPFTIPLSPNGKTKRTFKEDRNDLKADRQLAGEEYLKSLKTDP